MPCLRILLVDDSQEFLDSIANLLSLHPSLQVIGSAQSACAGLEQVEQLQPDLVLMDLAMPGMNGIEATRWLKARAVSCKVVILTLHDHTEYREAAKAAGADGFISKSEIATQIRPLIQALFQTSEISEISEV